jgi:osmotically-inducible protein OsmY
MARRLHMVALPTRSLNLMSSKIILASVLALGALGACKSSKEPSRVEADNTAKNQRDESVAPTADNAVARPSDLDVTQKIRKAVMDDDSLSTTAHNCKIVVENGKVTLVGPVTSPTESTRVAQIAANVVGDKNVINQLEVTN